MSSLNLPDNFSVVIPIVAGIGNALMAVPMVRAIRRAQPGARVAVAARINAMAEPFRRLTEVNEVFVFGGGIAGLKRSIAWTRQQTPDVYLVPFPSNRWQYNALAGASGAKHVVMHEFPLKAALGFATGATRVPAERGIHDVIQNLRLLPLLGIDAPQDEPPGFPLTQPDYDRAATLRLNAGIASDDKFIAIHAGSAKTVLAQAKRWPPALYAEVVQQLQAEFPHRIVLVEGPDEAGVAQEILGSAKLEQVAVIKLSGPLGDAAALLADAALYVGSDSGLAHLADAVGTRAVTLFAPADPVRVAPYGSGDLVVQAPTDCAPCLQYPWHATSPRLLCREPMCIKTITTEMVMHAVRKGLS